jgi:uncharacterized protein YjbI with pentapeptide repeats
MGADFTEANLTGASLKDSFLAGANFTRAKLEKADLKNAVLEDAEFEGADLTKANLTGIEILGHELDEAHNLPLSWLGLLVHPILKARRQKRRDQNLEK